MQLLRCANLWHRVTDANVRVTGNLRLQLGDEGRVISHCYHLSGSFGLVIIKPGVVGFGLGHILYACILKETHKSQLVGSV